MLRIIDLIYLIHSLGRKSLGRVKVGYLELTNENEINEFIVLIKRKFKDLSKILIPNDLEATASGKTIVPLYKNSEVVMKIEGYEALITEFIRAFSEEQKRYTANPKSELHTA